MDLPWATVVARGEAQERPVGIGSHPVPSGWQTELFIPMGSIPLCVPANIAIAVKITVASTVRAVFIEK